MEATNENEPTRIGKENTTDGKCDGCGRLLMLDDDPALLARGVLQYRVAGSPLPHNPTACVRAHGPDAGGLAYARGRRDAGPPKKLPPRRARKARRDALREVGA